MNLAEAWPWLGIGLLGVWHGVNPAMGWLFAVALGLQEDRGRAVWGALGPLALGHAAAIGGTVVLVGLIGLFWPLVYLKWLVALTLVGLGVSRLRRNRHPRWSRMRVRPRDLALWSLLMSSAHGAGLMVLPLVLATSTPGEVEMTSGITPESLVSVEVDGGQRAAQETLVVPTALSANPVSPVRTSPSGGGEQMLAVLVTLLHTAAYLITTGLVAVLVYQKLGLRHLRRAWLNVDLIWAGSLIITGVLTPLI